jgi:hypothetical protein
MFDRLKKALGLDPTNTEVAPPTSRSSAMPSRISEWASEQGYVLQESKPGALTRAGERFALSGRVGNKAWRIENGKPSRSFIRDHELRARAELGLPSDIALMAINSSLKDALEKKAFAAYTQSLQTVHDGAMGEELRWLTLYDQVRTSDWGGAFNARMVVLAGEPAQALRWMDATLRHQLLNWPSETVTADTPLILHIARGKLYLRMQYDSGDIPTLEHAVRTLVWASESALSAFSAKS